VHCLLTLVEGKGSRRPSSYVYSGLQETCHPGVFYFPLFPFLFVPGRYKVGWTARDVPCTKTSGRNGKMWKVENSGTTRFLEPAVYCSDQSRKLRCDTFPATRCSLFAADLKKGESRARCIIFVYLQQIKKKAKAEGKTCHAKN
jgi:hypothetical protein